MYVLSRRGYKVLQSRGPMTRGLTHRAHAKRKPPATCQARPTTRTWHDRAALRAALDATAGDGSRHRRVSGLQPAPRSDADAALSGQIYLRRDRARARPAVRSLARGPRRRDGRVLRGGGDAQAHLRTRTRSARVRVRAGGPVRAAGPGVLSACACACAACGVGVGCLAEVRHPAKNLRWKCLREKY